METFVLRFRDAEISKAFMDAVNKVIELNFMSISSKLNLAVLFSRFLLQQHLLQQAPQHLCLQQAP